MATFKTAYVKYIQPGEGGYSNVLADKGGETYAGIARNIYPNWSGWPFVDAKKSDFPNRIIPRNRLFSEMNTMVEQFYLGLWDVNKLGEIHSQDIANLLYDFFINSGPIAFKKIQRLVAVADDGLIGPLTIAAINNANATQLYSLLKNVRENFYNEIVKRDPSQNVFYSGWMNRLARFPDFITNNAFPLVIVLLLAGAILYYHYSSQENKNLTTSN